MVTLATFEKAEEAHTLRCVLEGAGIPAFVDDDLVVSVAWMYSNAIGGVKVRVFPEDRERAIEALRKGELLEPLQAGPHRECANCGSGKVEYQRWSPKVFFFSLLLLGVPLPFLKRSFQCLECGASWK